MNCGEYELAMNMISFYLYVYVISFTIELKFNILLVMISSTIVT